MPRRILRRDAPPISRDRRRLRKNRPTTNHSVNLPAARSSAQSPSVHSPAYPPVCHPARVRPTVRLGAQSRLPVHPSDRPRAIARPTIRIYNPPRFFPARPLILPFRPTFAGQPVLIIADDNRRAGDAFYRLLDILAIRPRRPTPEQRAFAPVSAVAATAGRYWIVHQLSSDSLLPSKRATVRTRPRYPEHSRRAAAPACQLVDGIRCLKSFLHLLRSAPSRSRRRLHTDCRFNIVVR